MALVKKIEFEITEDVYRRGFHIRLFDSNGDAYNFSEGINFPTANQEWSDGMKTMTAEFSLNGDPVGSVTVVPEQNYGGKAACLNSPYLWPIGPEHTPWLNNMLRFLFGAITDQPGPYKAILTFSKAIDIYKITLFQEEAGSGVAYPIGDLGIKVIGENQLVLANTVYTAEQQKLDYPIKEVTVGTYPYSYSYVIIGDGASFTPPFVPLNLRPTLPKSIKVMSIDGGLYIRPKQA